MKAYTDLEQSKKLAEILPLKSADICYVCGNTTLVSPTKYGDTSIEKLYKKHIIPAWSLAALFNILPKEIVYKKNIVYLEFHVWQNSLEYVNNADYILHITRSYGNPVDACVEMILKLKELNLL